MNKFIRKYYCSSDGENSNLSKPRRKEDHNSSKSSNKENEEVFATTSWSCEVCTFINEASQPRCNMCHSLYRKSSTTASNSVKTEMAGVTCSSSSSSSKRLVDATPSSNPHSHTAAGTSGKICPVCTFENSVDAKECEMCKFKLAYKPPTRTAASTAITPPVQGNRITEATTVSGGSTRWSLSKGNSHSTQKKSSEMFEDDPIEDTPPGSPHHPKSFIDLRSQSTLRKKKKPTSAFLQDDDDEENTNVQIGKGNSKDKAEGKFDSDEEVGEDNYMRLVPKAKTLPSTSSSNIPIPSANLTNNSKTSTFKGTTSSSSLSVSERLALARQSLQLNPTSALSSSSSSSVKPNIGSTIPKYNESTSTLQAPSSSSSSNNNRTDLSNSLIRSSSLAFVTSSSSSKSSSTMLAAEIKRDTLARPMLASSSSYATKPTTSLNKAKNARGGELDERVKKPVSSSKPVSKSKRNAVDVVRDDEEVSAEEVIDSDDSLNDFIVDEDDEEDECSGQEYISLSDDEQPGSDFSIYSLGDDSGNEASDGNEVEFVSDTRVATAKKTAMTLDDGDDDIEEFQDDPDDYIPLDQLNVPRSLPYDPAVEIEPSFPAITAHYW